jgi:hypothetical protein
MDIIELKYGGAIENIQSILRQSMGGGAEIGTNAEMLSNSTTHKHFFVVGIDACGDLAKTPNIASGQEWEIA